MDSHALGDFSVSRIGFGAMQLPGRGVWGPPRDRGEALTVLRRAVELGVDHIDTAQYYGPDVANELIREALRPYPDNLALVSKVGARRDQTGGWLPYQTILISCAAASRTTCAASASGSWPTVNLRLTGDEPDQRFDDQLAAMIQAREDGLIGGVGLSNVTLERLRRALERTPIACVQNPLNLADRSSMPVLQECAARGIAFVPFFPLGSAFAPDNPVLGNPGVRATAGKHGDTPAQVALAWTLGLAPNVLLIPGTSSVAHLEENVAVADVTLDERAQRELTEAPGISSP